MFVGSRLALFLCVSSFATLAVAETQQPPKGEVGLGAQAEPPKAGAGDAASPRRDPKGKKGINPYWEAIRRGDEAALTRDFAKAEEAYQAAIALDSRNAFGHFRRGQILVRAGKLTDAEVVYQDAMRLADKDPTLRAAALFALADLKERQGQRDAAITAWKAYSDYLSAEATAKGHPATATERDQRLKKYNELVVEGKAVRERIQLRMKELEEANKRKAAKNPNEGK